MIPAMTNPFTPGVGSVLSADVAVPEHGREVRFYTQVLGTGATPLWRDDLMNNLGLPIIGLGPRTEAHAELPLQWMPHVQVTDVAASAARAVALGGRVLMSDPLHAWAVLADPDGAAFGIIPVVPGDAVPTVDATGHVVGCLAGITLIAPDPSRSGDFYRQVVGWSMAEPTSVDAAVREMLAEAGHVAARIVRAANGHAGLPTVWLIHLPVGDLDESLRRVGAEGGVVLGDLASGAARAVVVRDPVGVVFALTTA